MHLAPTGSGEEVVMDQNEVVEGSDQFGDANLLIECPTDNQISVEGNTSEFVPLPLSTQQGRSQDFSIKGVVQFAEIFANHTHFF